MFNHIYYFLLNVFTPLTIKYVKLHDLDEYILNHQKAMESITIFHNFKKTPQNLALYNNIHDFIWNANVNDIKHLGVLSGKTYEEMMTPRKLSLIVNFPYIKFPVLYLDKYNLNPTNPEIADMFRLFTYTTWSHIYAIIYFFSEVFIHYSYRIIFIYYFSAYYYTIAKICYQLHQFFKEFTLYLNVYLEKIMIRFVNFWYIMFTYFEIHMIIVYNSIDEMVSIAIIVNIAIKISGEFSYWGGIPMKIKMLIIWTEDVILIANIHKNLLLEVIGNELARFIIAIPIDNINVPLDMFGISEFFLVSEKLEEVLEVINAIQLNDLLLEEKIYESLMNYVELKEIPLEDLDLKKCFIILIKITATVTIGLAVYILADENIIINLVENIENFMEE